LDLAAAVALNSAAEDQDRQQALELMGHGTFEWVAEKLRPLVRDASPEIRAAAVRTIAGYDRPEAAEMFLVGIEEQTPGRRREVFEAILGGRAMTSYFLEQVSSGHIAADLIDAGMRQRLWSHPHDALRHRARSVLPQDEADRQDVIDAYQAAVKGPGDGVRGRQVFERHCAACHRVGGSGTAVGPDIADNYNKTREQLLIAILDPNRLIDSSFEAYVVSTTSGRTWQGLLVGESTSAVTLKESEGKTTTIARQEIDELYPTGVSLMPTGIEKDIDVAAMSDLLTFLKEWRGEARREVSNERDQRVIP
jgi:putative heme-binding domain-containing protein